MGPSAGQRSEGRVPPVFGTRYGLADEAEVQVSRTFDIQLNLKFTNKRDRQAGQSSSSEVSRRDLRAELLAAEAEAKEKKRKAEGRPLEAPAPSLAIEGKGKDVDMGDEEANKRRKVLQDAIALDKDDESDEDKDDADDDRCEFSGDLHDFR